MKRQLYDNLLRWKNSHSRMPLILRGARQVGKTHLVRDFGRTQFEGYVELNFERNPELGEVFQENLDPHRILKELQVFAQQKIEPNTTLLFLDEIQECPQAIMALRYFCEEKQDLHVIAAGSLLEFAFRDEEFSMPVGRVQFLYLRPFSFLEYLTVSGEKLLVDAIREMCLDKPLPDSLHKRAIRLVREYCVVGGMPKALSEFLRQNNYLETQTILSSILQTYRGDFGKYAKSTKHKYLQRIFDKAPGLVSQWVKYSKIDPDMQSRDLKEALNMLVDTGLISKVLATSGSGLPLATDVNEKKFKLLFLDVGLVQRATRLNLELLLKDNLFLLNRGALTEQFVGQELLAYQNPESPEGLFFWVREKLGASAEVDYIVRNKGEILPVEVKSGSSGHLKSLKIFCEEKQIRRGIRISTGQLCEENGVLSIPLYALFRLMELSES